MPQRDLNTSKENNLRHVLLMAGGTGGHIYPALAVAEELKARGYRVSWLGSEGGMEESLIGNTDIPIHLLPVKGVRGKGKLALLKAPFVLMQCVMKARRLIRQNEIQLVIGFGGFASGPGGIAAYFCRKKLVLHEQNAIPGLTNKVLAKFASLVCEAFPSAFPDSGKVLTTGNPIRKKIIELSESIELSNARLRKKEESGLNVLVVGGSRGAQIFNQRLPELLSEFQSSMTLSVIHQTGAGNSPNVAQLYQANSVKVKYEVKEFIQDMASAYLWADVIVCRAGALTVSEVAAVGLPAIFVPYPHAVDDHQTKNAQFLVNQQAAVIVDQKDFEQISTHLQGWLNNSTNLVSMSKRMKEQAVLNATEVICDRCETLMNREAA